MWLEDSVAGTPSPAPTPKRLHLLLVEDSPDDEELVLMELRRGGYLVAHERVDTVEGMTAALAREDWDLVLSDYAMPLFSGPAALDLLRKTGRDIPLIIVSGTVGEEAAVAAMRSGANDYVFKGSLSRLCPAIERELREAVVRAERRAIQEQLLISDRMASVGTLAAGVAHELNNPLAAVVANLELVTKDIGDLSEELHIEGRMQDILDELRDAREGAERLKHIVRDLKIFSRSTDEERRGPVDVKVVLESSLRMAWNEIRHRARLEKDYGNVPAVHANEARLGQVFLNLIVNAAQAIPEGDAEHNLIRVSTRMDVDSGRVAVEVRDTGAGIAPEDLNRIFDAFFTTKAIGVGTGLGLSICHRIVTGLGGEIQVESQVGHGTSFRLLLLPTAHEAKPTTRKVLVAPTVKRGRVLVIDDEPAVAKALKRVLEGEHQITIAATAGDALARIAAGERYDVILCDLMMPQMTGMDLHAAFSRAAPEQAAQMVFLTGGGFTHSARRFLDEVPNQRIDKPFDIQQLRALVNDRVNVG